MLACENCYNDPCTCGYQGYLKWMLHLRITKTDKKPEKEKIMGDVEIKMLGSVYKSTVKPPKLDESGQVQSQDLEIVLRVPIIGDEPANEGVRGKLADLSRLQNGQTVNIHLANTNIGLFSD